MTPVPVRVWIDPSCPWAWQAHIWLHDLQLQGEIALEYAFFSLELNAAEGRTSFDDAATRYGRALRMLALARDEGGSPAVTALYVALGSRLHDRKRAIDDGLLREASREAELGHLEERAVAPELGDALIEEFHAARALDVFGVPTLQVAETKTMYGPIVALGPTGEDGLALWRSVADLLGRDVFFELKRWPRDVRPGGLPTGPGA